MSRRIVIALVAVCLVGLAVLVATSGDIRNVIPASPEQSVSTSSLASASDTAAPSADETMPTVIAQADFVDRYSTVDVLARQSDLIVRGIVERVEYLDFNTVTYSKVTLKVTKSFSPDVAEGDVVTVLEVGGVTSQAAIIESTGNKFNQAITETDKKTKVLVLLDGAPLPEVGDDAVYFLAAGSLGIVPGEYYDVVGAYHGKFTISNGQASRFAPESEAGAADDLTMDSASLGEEIDAAARNR